MELLSFIKEKILNNKILFVVLLVLAMVGGIMHQKLQKPNYVSGFQTTGGAIDYGIFKSLVDFTELDSSHFNLESAAFNEIQTALSECKVTYVQKGSNGLAFTLSTLNKDMDAVSTQNQVLTLLNENKLIKNSELRNIEILDKKLVFIEKKIQQLDSIMLNSNGTFALSKIPSDSYNLYAQQLELEEERNKLANFELVKPVAAFKENKRPLLLFLALYVFLAGLIFVFFSKKVKTN